MQRKECRQASLLPRTVQTMQASSLWIARPGAAAHLDALSGGGDKALHRGGEQGACKLLQLRLPPLQQAQPLSRTPSIPQLCTDVA